MSEENVEIVRRYFPAYEQGGLDAWAEFWHPDISRPGGLGREELMLRDDPQSCRVPECEFRTA